jgi:hypothetical protein
MLRTGSPEVSGAGRRFTSTVPSGYRVWPPMCHPAVASLLTRSSRSCSAIVYPLTRCQSDRGIIAAAAPQRKRQHSLGRRRSPLIRALRADFGFEAIREIVESVRKTVAEVRKFKDERTSDALAPLIKEREGENALGASKAQLVDVGVVIALCSMAGNWLRRTLYGGGCRAARGRRFAVSGAG